MARAGLVEIMDEMADQIRAALVTVTDVDIQVEPRMILSPSPPSIDIYPGEQSRDSETAAFDDVNGGYLFTVRARINTTDDVAAQDLLLAFMDDTDDLCLALALLDDPTLNALASDVDVRNPTGYIVYPEPTGEGAWLGFQFTALVIPANT